MGAFVEDSKAFHQPSLTGLHLLLIAAFPICTPVPERTEPILERETESPELQQLLETSGTGELRIVQPMKKRERRTRNISEGSKEQFRDSVRLSAGPAFPSQA